MPPTITVHPLPGGEPPPGPHRAAEQLTLATPAPVPRGEGRSTVDDPPALSRTLEEAAAQAGANAVLRLIVEVIDGRRSAGHLERAVSPAVLSYLTAALRAGLRPRRRTVDGGQAKIRSVHLQLPSDGIAEVSAVWQRAGRIAALAARFEQAEDAVPLGWRCTYLRLG